MIKTVELERTGNTVRINARGMEHRELNQLIKEVVDQGATRIELSDVFGQRYIGTGLHRPVEIDINGVPGNDLGAFMDGHRIVVYGNAQDGCGNTMNSGEIIIHGHAGDIVGLSARGGSIFVRDSAGYRAGIHIKEYQKKKPAIVIGGTAQDFLGEYMAGGVLILLGLNLRKGENYPARFIGTGMHGGVIYLRDMVENWQLGKEVGTAELDDNDRQVLGKYVSQFADHFGLNEEMILGQHYIKLYPRWLRPYGQLYAP